MGKKPAIAIIDVGKTNKKMFLLNEDYDIVFEKTARFPETTDEDGFPCENIDNLQRSTFDALRQALAPGEFEVKAVNFSTYGASLVYIDERGKPAAPLYNYLKPYPAELQERLYKACGGAKRLSLETASPALGSLNSGLQLYRIKYEQPQLFEKIRYALHLPQYMSYLITKQPFSDITSIGCHTALWDFQKNDYHNWVKQEGLQEKLAPVTPSDKSVTALFSGAEIQAGVGLHDSSAALIPYLKSFKEPFALISTGTWCISMNPFNQAPLTREELSADCLYFLQYNRKPVKASRLFAGYEHEEGLKRIAAHFHQSPLLYRKITFNPEIFVRLSDKNSEKAAGEAPPFSSMDLSRFSSGEEAYCQLMLDLTRRQYESTQLVLKDAPVKKLFVDGGFSKNEIYMNLLAQHFPNVKLYAASVAQATAMGAAMAIHSAWHPGEIPGDIVKLKPYSFTPKETL